MKRTMIYSLVLALPALLVAVQFISSAHAGSSVVDDPAADVGSSPPYLDVIHAKVTEQDGSGTLFFLMELAGAVPKAPSESDLIWPFHIDTDPGASPGGLYVDYVVRVRWVNGAFVGQVVNRTAAPTLTITSVPFSVDGATVKVFVDPTTLGNPASFHWNASTRPGATVPYVDFAPDASGPTDSSTLATWTQ